jgi:hypothetical protein
VEAAVAATQRYLEELAGLAVEQVYRVHRLELARLVKAHTAGFAMEQTTEAVVVVLERAEKTQPVLAMDWLQVVDAAYGFSAPLMLAVALEAIKADSVALVVVLDKQTRSHQVGQPGQPTLAAAEVVR